MPGLTALLRATHMEHLRADVGALVTDVGDNRSIVGDTRIDLAR
jgi:hypothetical protein